MSRNGAGTEKDCHGREDPRMVENEKRTGTTALNSVKPHKAP